MKGLKLYRACGKGNKMTRMYGFVFILAVLMVSLWMQPACAVTYDDFSSGKIEASKDARGAPAYGVYWRSWCALRDSNLRRLGGVSRAGASCRNPDPERSRRGRISPDTEPGREVVRPERFEPPTFWFVA